MSQIRKFGGRTYYGNHFISCLSLSKAAAEKDCRPTTEPRPKETVILTVMKKLQSVLENS